MSRLTQSIRTCNEENKKAVIPYIPGWYPKRDLFWDLIKQMDEAGVSAIEIGVPFSDPVADGPVVEAASLQCLENGVSLAALIKDVREHAHSIKAPLIFMGYYNCFREYGLERLAKDASEAGIAALIIPDLPFEEAEDPRETLNAAGVELIPLIGMNTAGDRLEKYAQVAQGFVYFVSVLGTTGVRESFDDALEQALQRARKYFSIPIALGFGIKSISQIQELGENVDAGIVGSAMLQYIAANGDVRGFFKK